MEKKNVFMLPGDFFERDKVIFVKSMQGGTVFLNILLKLYAKFSGAGGKITVDGMETSAEQTMSMIASATRNRLVDVRRAVDLFLDMGFMEERDGFLYLTDTRLIGSREGGVDNGR